MTDDQDPALGPDTPERPDWLPQKFASPEALAHAYESAERKISWQGMQLATQREALEAFSSNQPIEAPTYEYDQQQELARMQELAEQAQRPAVDPNLVREGIRQVASRINPGDMIASRADQLLANQVPNWTEVKVKVGTLISADAAWQAEVERAVQSGSPTELASVLSSAASVVRANHVDTRAMKLQAQGLQGGGGRPSIADDEQSAWARVVGAGPTSYSDLMSRGGG